MRTLSPKDQLLMQLEKINILLDFAKHKGNAERAKKLQLDKQQVLKKIELL